MMPGWLLNWRVWAVLAFLAAEAFAGYKLHHAGYETGRAQVQGLFDAFRADALEQAMAAQVARQAQESAMQAKNQKVTADYVSLQTATGVAVRALDADRMRLQAIIAASRHPPGQDSSPGLPPDDSATTSVLAACIDQYAGVVSDFDREADKLRGLQAYVSAVCPGPDLQTR